MAGTADMNDAASEIEAFNLELALRTRKPELPITGTCYNCDEPIPDARFCDADCRDDYEKRVRN